jgi:hypothetical protein
MAKVILEIDVKNEKDLEELKKTLGAVNKETEDLADNNEELADSSKRSTAGMGALDKATGGAITKVKGLVSGFKAAIVSAKGLKVAIAATGIGALVLAIVAVGQAFTRSEEGQNKFRVIMAAIGAVTDQLLDLLSALGRNIISVFENPRESIEKFWKILKENVVNRIVGLTELIPKLGEAISLVFEGEFSAAAKVATDAVGKVATGVDSITDSFNEATQAAKDFFEETKKEALEAIRIQNLLNDVDVKARELLVARARANARIAGIRAKVADRDSVSAKERIALLEEGLKLNKNILAQEIDLATKRLQAKVAQNALGDSTKADLDEEAQLRANLINLQTSAANTEKALLTELRTARAEARKPIKTRDKETGVGGNQEAILEETEADRIEAALIRSVEVTKVQLARRVAAQEEADSKIMASRKAVLDNFIDITGAESKVGKAFLVVKELLNAKEIIMEASKTLAFSKLAIAKSQVAVAEGTAQTAKIGFPQNIPMLIGYAAQAVGIFSAIKSAVGASKSVASGLGGSGGGGGATAPQIPQANFNVVGDSGIDTLADSISSQQNQPIRAYVTQQDITTNAQMERETRNSSTV